jgi:hypothetical protein
MKKSIGSLLIFFIYMILEAVNPSVQFPSRLGGSDEKKFELEFHRPVSSIESDTISSVIVEGHYELNGKLLVIPQGFSNYKGQDGEQLKGFRGSMQFYPAAHIDTVRTCLDNAHLVSVNQQEGRFEAHYRVPADVMGDQKDIKVSTEQSGRVYQCPMPHMIHVGNHVKTPFVYVESNPVCHGLNDALCQKKKRKAYVHRNNTYCIEEDKDSVVIAPMGEKVLSKTYMHSAVGSSSVRSLRPEDLKYCTHGAITADIKPTMISDDTAHVPSATPLKWKIMKSKEGDNHLFAYGHYAQCGDKILQSKPLELSADAVSIAIPGAHRMGFKMIEKETHTDEQGNIIIPPLYATRFIEDDNKHITMHCMYGNPHNKEDMLVLSASLEVPAQRCYLYGKDARDTREFNAAQLHYGINKDVTVVSRTDKKSEAPIALHVLPASVAR